MKFPNLPRKGVAVIETIREIINYIRSSRVVSINGVSGKVTTNGTTFQIPTGDDKQNPDSKPPFWPTLRGNDTNGYDLIMKKGWVSSTHWKYGVQSVVTIEVTSIPGDPDPVDDALSVLSGSKIYATLTENAYGEITAATIQNGASWPTSSAASLIGGDDQTGAAGVRYVRLCEIVTIGGSVRVKVIHTGNIEHSAPTLTENLTTSPSTGEARVMKQWNASAGRWDFRYLEGGYGISMEENADTIGVSVTGSALNLTVTDYEEDSTTGIMTQVGSPVTHYWRRGLYIGTTDPADSPGGLITEEVTNVIPA